MGVNQFEGEFGGLWGLLCDLSPSMDRAGKDELLGPKRIICRGGDFFFVVMFD